MKHVAFLLLAALILPSAARPQAGTDGLAFLKLGVGGRPLGMGEAAAASTADPSASFYNPAALASAGHAQILLMHKNWTEGVETEYLAAATSWGSVHLGLSVNATSVNDIEIRSVPGPPIGTFSSRNGAIGLTAAFFVTPELSIGLTGKFLYEKILVEEASGAGFDAGLLYTTPWKLRIGASVANLGSMNALADESSKLPRIVRIGGAYDLLTDTSNLALTLASDYVGLTTEGSSHLHAGAELRYQQVFAIRAGWQTGYDSRNFSAGAGVRYSMLMLDYAFSPFRDDFGTTHTISLLLDFP